MRTYAVSVCVFVCDLTELTFALAIVPSAQVKAEAKRSKEKGRRRQERAMVQSFTEQREADEARRREAAEIEAAEQARRAPTAAELAYFRARDEAAYQDQLQQRHAVAQVGGQHPPQRHCVVHHPLTFMCSWLTVPLPLCHSNRLCSRKRSDLNESNEKCEWKLLEIHPDSQGVVSPVHVRLHAVPASLLRRSNFPLCMLGQRRAHGPERTTQPRVGAK